MLSSNYISVNRIFAKLRRDYGLDNINESDVIEWAAEALEAIGAITLYEQSVAFIEVKNFQCSLPFGLHSIHQIARNNCWQGDPCDVCKTVVEEIPQEESCNKPVPLDCNGQPLTEYEVAYYRPYFDLRLEHFWWSNSKTRQGCFTPVRPTNHSFFSGLICQEEGQEVYTNCSDEYTVVANSNLRFSFQEGQIALSYYKQQLDEEGYPMIPDEYSYTTAITKYIILKLSEREFYNNREGSGARVQKAEADWHWYCKQAANAAMIPKLDEWQNILNQRNRMIPKLNRYFGFFGNLSKIEGRKYNDPDSRNKPYFR